jgi:hypothetical protein
MHVIMQRTSKMQLLTEVAKDLAPCLTFIQGKQNKPSQKCCDGAKLLNNAAETQPDRQDICECIY